MADTMIHLNAPVLGSPFPALRTPALAQLGRYAVVGGLGTATNAVVFLLLRSCGKTLPANLAALAVSTLVSTEINRRFTFAGAVVPNRWRVHAQNGATVAFYACYSTVVLLVLALLVEEAAPLTETVVVAAASVLGGFGRYVVLCAWVYPPTAS